MKPNLGLLRAEELGMLNDIPLVPMRTDVELVQRVHLDPAPLEFDEPAYEEAVMEWFNEPGFRSERLTMIFVPHLVFAEFEGAATWWGWTVHLHRDKLYRYQSVALPHKRLSFIMTLKEGTLYRIETRQLVPWGGEKPDRSLAS